MIDDLPTEYLVRLAREADSSWRAIRMLGILARHYPSVLGLLAANVTQILAYKGMGFTTLGEIYSLLKEHGLTFSDPSWNELPHWALPERFV